MLTEEKMAGIEIDSSSIRIQPCTQKQVHQKMVKKIFWKYQMISQPREIFLK
jgi:hypothetical protein